MKSYILNAMKQKKHGLYLFELPTGIGKTYNSAQAMKEYAEQIEDNRKIIYLTTLNKNLPEDALKAAYQDNALYEKNVLRIRANFDEVVEKINNIEVPEGMKSEVYNKLCKDVALYHNAVNNKYADKEYILDLIKRIKEGDSQLRYEIRKQLINTFSNKEDREDAIRNNKDYKWIGKLYPAVFTNDYKILLMSISKFMKKNSILTDKSYEFLSSDLIKDAIIIIDEFDATKDTIQNELIEKSLVMQDDYIQLFRQIYRMISLDNFSYDMKESMHNVKIKKYTFDKLINEAKKIEETYHINLSIKTKDDLIDKNQTFLFNDGTFHTISKKEVQYISAILNEKDNKIDIIFENKEEFPKNRNKDKDINLYSLLYEINLFLSHFKLFFIEWAKNYMTLINNSRSGNVDEMSLKDAISSILKKLELTHKQQDFLMIEPYKMGRNNKNFILKDRSFYQVGIEYYEFEDSDSHYDNTNLNFIKVYDTPEKIILYLTDKATVLGISATAEFNTVLGNYDLDYLKEQLGEKYNCTPKNLKEKIQKDLELRWSAYSNRDINIHADIISSDSDNSTSNAEEYCKTFLNDEMARYCTNLINKDVDDKYQILRYCNLLRAMSIFYKTKDIQSMLYLGMALPKKNNPPMDEELIKQLFDEHVCRNSKDNELIILKSENFDSEKEKLQSSLAKGEKIFVISSYQTIGAGQNLQYKIPKGKDLVRLGDYTKDDKRYLYKDFDALYLGNITNMIVNTYSKQKITLHSLLKMLFQVEELYENGEINYSKKDEILKLAFRAYIGNKEYTKNELNELYGLKSVNIQASRIVLQAVGRMCRTFIKNPNIYLFIESKLLDNLYVSELEKRILPPEMKKIISLKKNLNKVYLKEENKLLNKAERVSLLGNQIIKIILSKHWTENSIKLWKEIRELVLRYPTANKEELNKDEYLNKNEELNKDEYLNKLYITSGNKQNSYIYSQKWDFKDIVINFENDKLAFKNSERAKERLGSNEFIIYDMNEKEARLPMILKYPGMKEYFKKCGYALEFKMNEYLISPAIFNNIYKGALGEVAGKFILYKELGIKLEPITETEYFEYFDFQLSKDVYVDFKNWKFSYTQDKDKTREEILKKMEAIGAKRVYIINIFSDKSYKPSVTTNHSLVEIPMLIKEDGTVCYECLHMIFKEDFEKC